MISPIIHYCWFGKKRPTPLVKKCINSWNRYCPNYIIIKWDETNFCISKAPYYVQEAAALKKWAYVSDYVRLWVIYNYGGIYLDTDVELLKPLDSLLSNTAFFGIEKPHDNPHAYVNTGLGFGSIPHNTLVKQLLDEYINVHFDKGNGSLDLLTCPKRNEKVFIKYGFNSKDVTQIIGNTVFYDSRYFCPSNWWNSEVLISAETYSVHHFACSWKNNKRNWLKKIMIKTKRVFRN